MRDIDHGQAGYTEAFAGRFGNCPEPVSADRDGRFIELLQFDRIADTPRRTGTSVALTVDDEVGAGRYFRKQRPSGEIDGRFFPRARGRQIKTDSQCLLDSA